MIDLTELLADLADESAELDALVSPLSAADWDRPTPAPGWRVAHQIAHLAWTDHIALLAATDVDAFRASAATAADDPTGFVDRGAAEFLAPPDELLARWRSGRAALATALAATATGPVADAWLDVAQAFAGPPGGGRTPAADTGSTPAAAAGSTPAAGAGGGPAGRAGTAA